MIASMIEVRRRCAVAIERLFNAWWERTTEKERFLLILIVLFFLGVLTIRANHFVDLLLTR